MVIIWLASCAISAPQAFVATITDSPPFKYCLEEWTGKGGLKGNRIYTIVSFIVLLAIPIVVICGNHVIILRTLWRPEPVLGGEESSARTIKRRASHCVYNVKRVNKKRKTTYMLLTVIVAFLVCMLPFQVITVVSVFVGLPHTEGYIVLRNIATGTSIVLVNSTTLQK